MKLSELKKGDHAIILKIETDESLKARLTSFGIARGTSLSIEECSLGNNTIEILVDDTFIGLRAKEASNIMVKKV